MRYYLTINEHNELYILYAILVDKLKLLSTSEIYQLNNTSAKYGYFSIIPSTVEYYINVNDGVYRLDCQSRLLEYIEDDSTIFYWLSDRSYINQVIVDGDEEEYYVSSSEMYVTINETLNILSSMLDYINIQCTLQIR